MPPPPSLPKIILSNEGRKKRAALQRLCVVEPCFSASVLSLVDAVVLK